MLSGIPGEQSRDQTHLLLHESLTRPIQGKTIPWSDFHNQSIATNRRFIMHDYVYFNPLRIHFLYLFADGGDVVFVESPLRQLGRRPLQEAHELDATFANTAGWY